MWGRSFAIAGYVTDARRKGSMNKNFSLFLALRYLKPKGTFVSVITAISVIGVTLGVGVLLIVIAVMSGFEQEFKEQLLKFEPHIIATPRPEAAIWEDVDENWGEVVDDPDNPFGDPPEEGEAPVAKPARLTWREIRARLETLTGVVVQCSPFTDDRVVLGRTNDFGDEFNEACAMIGVDEGDEAQIKRMSELITVGQFDLAGNNIILSDKLARLLHVYIGDEIQIYAPKMFERILKIMRELQAESDANPNRDTIAGLDEFRAHLADLKPEKPTAENLKDIMKSFRLTQEALRKRGYKSIEEKINEIDLGNSVTVAGIFNSPQHEHFAFVPLGAAQRMHDNFGDNVHGLWITTPDGFLAEEYIKEIAANMPSTWNTISWMKKWEWWFNIVKSERVMMFFVLVFIILVAAFSIMNTMIIVTVQKRREIGMMRALGARGSQIIGVFLWQGIIVGLIGTLSGVGFGLTVLHFRNAIRDFAGGSLGFEIFPASTFGIDHIPMRLEGMEIALICVVAFILCAIAAIPPAWAVARLDPAKALRNSS
jgi:lipoprotein-releasing system permease protein